MWLFLSRRIRLWLLVAVGLPLARTLVHQVSSAVQRRNPDTTAARVLRRADSSVASLARRGERRRRRA
jgi:hypothetical protein